MDDSQSQCSEFSPGGNLSSLSLNFSSLSIDNSSSPRSRDSFALPSNLSLSQSAGDVSIAYELSFDEPEQKAPKYSIKNKRKLKSCPKLSIDSGYSPLATDLMSTKQEHIKQKRFSEFFRSEMSSLTPGKALMNSVESDGELSFGSFNLEDKENLSLDCSDKSIRQDSFKLNIENKPLKKTRFSEHFRSEFSGMNISSPDISFDLSDSLSKNELSKLSLSLGSYNPDSRNTSLSIDGSNHGSPNVSFNASVPLESSPDRHRKVSDEDALNIQGPGTGRSRGAFLDSSSEDEEDSCSSVPAGATTPTGSDNSEYDSSFIDDEAEEGEETCSEASLSDSSDYQLNSQSGESSQDSEVDAGEYITPRTGGKVKDTPFFTPVTGFKTPSKPSTNLYQTPSTFCYPSSPKSRRKTALATPLSVRTNTGTPGLPNRVYSRNTLKLAHELFSQFNEFVFSNQLPRDMEIKLNKRLNTTAGRCIYLRKNSEYRASIELSPKVVDCLDRLKETLAHEMCHAATWLIDRKMDQHGPLWKRWAARVNEKYPELPPVSRCHSYEIKYKFVYKCSEAWCKYSIGRHSKSINLDKALCPLCYGRLVLPPSSNSATPNKAPNRWTEFMKSRFSEVKSEAAPGTPHTDLMKILSREFKQLKTSNTS